jgi:hypothetical protein
MLFLTPSNGNNARNRVGLDVGGDGSTSSSITLVNDHEVRESRLEECKSAKE